MPSLLGNRAATAIKLGAVATASAIAGGLAVAWFYRETLRKLQNSVKSPNIHNSGYSKSGLSDDMDQLDTAFDQSEPGVLPHFRDELQDELQAEP